jgi:glucosamine-6-phosphate deaminase
MTAQGYQTAGPAPLVLEHSRRVGLVVAELVANRIRARPDLRLILPTGRTPSGMYEALRAHDADGSLPAAKATVFQLDEYVGLGPDDERSFASYLRHELRSIEFGTLHTLDGTAPDLDEQCSRHQALLDEQPIDLAVLGLGRDGHVAFDEPGSTLGQGTRRVQLHESTRTDAQEAFGGLDRVPREAITVGLRTLAAARELIVVVTGGAKAAALRAMLEEDPSPDAPASLLRHHPRLTVVCDREAAIALRPRAGWSSDRALVVLGHRDPAASAPHRISDESLARVTYAERLARRLQPKVVVLTGHSRTPGGLSEAEQMKEWWDEADVPAVLEVAGHNTAENASRSLPILRAIGEIRQVVVVTSPWHLRAPYFFAPYRAYGITTIFRPAPSLVGWKAMWRELAHMGHIRGQRRQAFAELRLPAESGLPSS